MKKRMMMTMIMIENEQLWWIMMINNDINTANLFLKRLIIGSDRRPETKQGIERKKLLGSDREGLGIVLGSRVGEKDRRSEPDSRSEAISFVAR